MPPRTIIAGCKHRGIFRQKPANEVRTLTTEAAQHSPTRQLSPKSRSRSQTSCATPASRSAGHSLERQPHTTPRSVPHTLPNTVAQLSRSSIAPFPRGYYDGPPLPAGEQIGVKGLFATFPCRRRYAHTAWQLSPSVHALPRRNMAQRGHPGINHLERQVPRGNPYLRKPMADIATQSATSQPTTPLDTAYLIQLHLAS